MPLIDKILSLPLHVLNHWSYTIILLSTLLESSPIFGLLIPGQVIVIIGGLLAKLNIIDLGDVIFFSSLGAILGDLLGYLIGKKYGYDFIKDYGKYFYFKKEHYEQTKRLMNEHVGKTLIFGRFNSLTRSFAPFVAGSTDVSFMLFLIYNIIGGISWGLSYSLIGYIFGHSYKLASKYVSGIMLILFFLVIGISYYKMRKLK